MSISFYTQNPYMQNPYAQLPSYRQPISESRQAKDEQRSALTSQMRQMIRELEKTQKPKANPFAATSEDRADGFMDLTSTKESEEEKKIEKPVDYNYKEVATKIQRAKTSLSAGQALLSAKRKVVQMKRKIAAGEGDPEDLQCALTHARRMEMVARKKKHHLEIEEMVAVTRKRDERLQQQEDAASDFNSAMVTAAEDQVAKEEDKIFEERDSMMEEGTRQMQEGNSSEEMLQELNRMLSELGEEQLKELEEAMEMLESMEIVNPHISKEQLEDLKRKHRAAENKALMKADMDYLKETIRHQAQKAAELPQGAQSPSGMAVFASPALLGADISMPGAAAAGAGSIDVQV